MQKEQVIFKGTYVRPQPEGLVDVKQYIFVRGDDGKKKLLLRMSNSKNEACTRFTFILYRLDVKGNVIGQERLESSGREYAPFEVFGYEREIEVEEKCTDIIVKLVFAKYGSYTYHVENDKVFVTYSERSEESPKKEKKEKVKEHKVRSRVFEMSWIFALVFLLVVSVAFVATGVFLRDYKEIESDFSLSGVHYSFVDDKKEDVVIVGCSQNYKDVVLKNEVDGHKVVGVKTDAFKNNNHLVRITVEGINIDENAFNGCEKLDTVVIKNVAEIGVGAFANCKALRSVTIEGKTQNALVSIGSGAFADCKELKTVSINQRLAYGESVDYFRGSYGIEELNLYSFCYKDKTYDGTGITTVASLFGKTGIDKAKLKSLSIEEMSHIPAELVCGFKSLASVKINSEISEIGDRAFQGCSSLSTATHKGKLITVGAFAFEGTAITSIDLSFAEDIMQGAFLNATKLAAVIGYGYGGLDYVPDQCFEGCVSLSTISLGTEVESLGDYAFKGTSLTSFKVGEGVECGYGVVAECEKLTKLELYEMKDGQSIAYFFGIDTDKTIDRIAADLPENLSQITLSSGTKINDYAFAGCSSVETFNLPSGITSIGEYAFALCEKISELALGEGLLSIGAFAFKDTALVHVSIPQSVEYIGVGALNGCSKLESLTVPFLGSQPNEETGRISHLFGGDNAEAPSSLDSISLIANYPMVILPDYAFADCGGATVINIPATISVVGVGAFYNCKSLTDIDISNVTSIGDSAFSKCWSLVAPRLCPSLESIGAYAFEESGIAVLEIPAGVTSIGQGVIKGCNRLVSLSVPFLGRAYDDNSFNNIAYFFDKTNGICKDIPSTLTEISITKPFYNESIGAFAFYGCKNVTTFNYMGSVTTVGESAFYECSGLKAFDFSRISSIGSAAFAYSGIKEAILPDGLRYIRQSAFEGCASLTKVTLPSSLYVISENAFEGTGITSIEVPLGVYAIGEKAFYGSKITDAKIPDTVTSMGVNIFGQCNSLESVMIPLPKTIYGSGQTVSEYMFEGNIPSCLKSITVVHCADGYVYEDAFAYAENVEEIIITAEVYFIESGAFFGCSNLRYVYIPSTVTSVATDAFGNCTRLYEITNKSGAAIECGSIIEYTSHRAPLVDADGYRYSYLNGVWYMINYPSEAELEIPEGFVYEGANIKEFQIPHHLFYKNSVIKSVTIPGGVSGVGKSAFALCPALTSVTFKDDSCLTVLGESAFANCGSLKTVVLPNSLEAIGRSAFEGDYSLESVTFPRCLVSIGQKAFYDCQVLNCVKLYERVNAISTDAFTGCDGLFDVYNASVLSLVAGDSGYGGVALNAVKVHTDMNASPSEEINIDGLGKFRTGGGEWLLLSGENVEKLVLGAFTHKGQTVERYRISSGAFQGRTAIVELVVKGAVSEIAPYTFFGCSSIVTVDLSEASGLIKIGDYAFADCFAIKSVKMPNSVKTIGENAFSSCSLLEEITMPRSLEVIGAGAFKDCSRLISITVYENVISIGEEAFAGCRMLYEVFDLSPHITIIQGDSLNGGIGAYASQIFTEETEGLPRQSFDGAKLIKAFGPWYLYSFEDMGKSIITIGELDSGLVVLADSMSGATYRAIVLPSCLATLKEGAFNGCYSLGAIYYSGSIDDWENVSDEGEYSYFYNLYYYSECIHGSVENAWTYDKDGNVTTSECALDCEVIREADCYEVGEVLYTCPCGCGYENREYSDKTTHNFVNGTCEICGRTRVKVTNENLDSLIEDGYITAYKFAYEVSFGGIVSKNTEDSTTATFTITAKETMTLSFTYGVSCQVNGDFLVIVKNGVSWAKITGKNAGTFNEILEAGESVTISYEKNDSISGGDDQGYIKDLELFIIISEND